MNIVKYCLFIIAVSVSSLSVQADNSLGQRYQTSVVGKWVASDTFVRKNTYCYREYICKPSGNVRFGRNVTVKSTQLQRARSTCDGSGKACICNTAPPVLTCKIKYLKRR